MNLQKILTELEALTEVQARPLMKGRLISLIEEIKSSLEDEANDTTK